MATSMMEMSGTGDGGARTGTGDATYDLISTLYHALQGADQCETFAEDSDDDELRQFHQQSMQMHRQLADQAKQLLAQRLSQENGGSSGGAMFGGTSTGSSDMGSATDAMNSGS